jgi:hypothetical protein
MTTLSKLRDAMNSIAGQKGDFALFGLFMRADSPGRWDLVVAAPWLEVGKLKGLAELVGLLEDQLGEREARGFAKIVTLKPSSPEIRAELAMLNIDGPEKRFYNATLFGADVEEAVILRAKPLRAASERSDHGNRQRRVRRQRKAEAASMQRVAD